MADIKIPGLDNNLTFLLGMTYTQFRNKANKVLNKDFGITLEALTALRVLDHLGEITQQELSDGTGRDRLTTKRIADKCINLSLIQVNKKDTNKKARYLELTPKGKEIKENALKCLRLESNEFYSSLTDSESKLLIDLLKKILDQIDV